MLILIADVQPTGVSRHLLWRCFAPTSPRLLSDVLPLAVREAPTPAAGGPDRVFGLNKLLFCHPDAKYLVRVMGERMSWAEIHAGDLLAVDKHLEADHGHIVVAVVAGDCTVKRLKRRGNAWWLVPANPAFAPYCVHSAEEVHI